MSDHYYTNDPTSKSDRTSWEATLLGQSFTFVTDAGVFSKDRVDYGSQVLLDSIEVDDFPEGDILEIGCGYGPISLAVAKAYPDRKVHMVDVNDRALQLAKENAENNHVSNVSIYSSDLYTEVQENDFAGILSNPPIRAGKKVVHQILEEAYHYLKPEGMLTIVIQRKQGAPSAKKKMEDIFGNVERLGQDKGYWVLQSTKEAD